MYLIMSGPNSPWPVMPHLLSKGADAWLSGLAKELVDVVSSTTFGGGPWNACTWTPRVLLFTIDGAFALNIIACGCSLMCGMQN